MSAAAGSGSIRGDIDGARRISGKDVGSGPVVGWCRSSVVARVLTNGAGGDVTGDGGVVRSVEKTTTLVVDRVS